jgi:hypothetical protein
MTSRLTDYGTVTIRRAADADRHALERLAALDSARPPAGETLVAEAGGEQQAAIEVATGATIADPFRPTAHLVELLELRAAGLRRSTATPRRPRLGLRSALRAA